MAPLTFPCLQGFSNLLTALSHTLSPKKSGDSRPACKHLGFPGWLYPTPCAKRPRQEESKQPRRGRELTLPSPLTLSLPTSWSAGGDGGGVEVQQGDVRGAVKYCDICV